MSHSQAIEVATFALVLAATMCFVTWCVRVWLSDPGQYCSGAMGGMIMRTCTLGVVHPVCGYNLGSHSSTQAGGFCCPECGRRYSSSRSLARSTCPIRTFRLGVVFIATAAAINTAHGLRWSYVLRPAPTGLLLASQTLLADRTPSALRRELHQRWSDHAVHGDQLDRYVILLVRDLHSDGVRFNAENALDVLGEIGQPAVLHLRRALTSRDWQQRQMAAAVLHRLNVPPSDDLVRISIEGLRDDALPWGRKTNFVFNARQGVRYLAEHAKVAEAQLIRSLQSADLQQRFLSAAALGFGGRSVAAEQAAPILIAQLRDNQVSGDALFAMRALYGFGSAVLEPLQAVMASDDRQQRELAAFLIWKLQSQSATLDLPPPDIKISTLATDPTELNWRLLHVPRFP